MSKETHAPQRKSLWPFYHEVSQYEYANQQKARELIDRILEEGLDNYTAPPDLWHNTAMVAGKVKHTVAKIAFVEAGLREWPDNVDLLCDELQYWHITHYDLQKAAAIWQRLEELPREVTGPHWRFWVYGAIYHALALYNPQKGMELLDEGLKWVKRDGLMDVLRSYRRVLVDSIPLEPIKDNRQFSAYQKHVFELLEERYLLGLRMGVENGYVLAVELARLYQEQASGGALDRLELKGNEEDEQSLHTSSNHYLQRALQYLDLAEILYTGDPNHPIWEIYEARARILMAQRRYGDALKLLSSLPQSRRNEPSIATMLNLAIRITGEKIETDESDSSSFSELLSSLFQNDGELLFRIASQNPQVARVLRNVVQRL